MQIEYVACKSNDENHKKTNKGTAKLQTFASKQGSRPLIKPNIQILLDMQICIYFAIIKKYLKYKE